MTYAIYENKKQPKKLLTSLQLLIQEKFQDQKNVLDLDAIMENQENINMDKIEGELKKQEEKTPQNQNFIVDNENTNKYI